ncbi:unnamed protein product [Candidula unifasciata]|uniref:TLC domain-containing protein n=1 Tax=Candidula unifasciata TaxID=100452 RepID=A0A8S3ZS53_9EUPU|nr:unnamed protein product [Candidula unifasciata]
MAAPVTTLVEEEEIIQYLHPYLLTLNYEKYAVKLLVIFTALLLFSTLFLVSWIIFSPLAAFRSLRIKEKIFWNLAVVRAVFGVAASVIGAWTIFTHTNYHRDIVFGQTATGSFTMNATIGFFLFECIALITSDIIFHSFSCLLHVHHMFCTIVAAVVTLSEAGYSLSLMSLSLEMSTPFSAVCWILLKSGMGSTKYWLINQMILLHTFHLRSVVECYIWWLTFKEWSIIWKSMPWITFVTGYTALALFTFIATPYWGYKKTLQLANPVDWNFESNARNPVQNGHTTKLE